MFRIAVAQASLLVNDIVGDMIMLIEVIVAFRPLSSRSVRAGEKHGQSHSRYDDEWDNV